MTSVRDHDVSRYEVDAPDDLEAFQAWARDRRWSDGLPLIPPTPERVERMLAATDWPADRVVGEVPPRYAGATVAAIAANAVLAGCAPSAMPVLIAATEAACDPDANAYGAQATTHSCALMVLVTGPVAAHAGVSGGAGMFGHGHPGNVTIGRAMRLVLQNVGGAYPGDTDHATQGTPAKIAFCFGENDEANPWEPYRVSRGFPPEASVVSVVFAEGPHNLNDHVSTSPSGLAFMMAHTIATVGKNNPYCPGSDYFVVLGPEHAATFARHGWKRSDLQEYLHERARIRYKDWCRGAMFGLNPEPKYLDAADDDMMVRITDRPDDVHVVVAGGPGLHSSWIPTFGKCKTIAKAVTTAHGAVRVLDG